MLGEGRSKQDSEPSVSALVRDHLVVLSLFVLFCGIVATEAYYAAFGIRYQTLGVAVEHLVYRGITTVARSPVLLLLLFAATVWLATIDLLEGRRRNHRRFRLIASYGLVFLLIVGGGWASRRSGIEDARLDMTTSTTRLVRLECLTSGPSDPKIDLEDHRLIIAGDDYLFSILPQDDVATSVPTVSMTPKEACLGYKLRM
jgi:hypothetical protein